MADMSNGNGRTHLQGWAMPVITIAIGALGVAVNWGIQQRDRQELSRHIERFEAANTSERLAVIETKLDLIASC